MIKASASFELVISVDIGGMKEVSERVSAWVRPITVLNTGEVDGDMISRRRSRWMLLKILLTSRVSEDLQDLCFGVGSFVFWF